MAKFMLEDTVRKLVLVDGSSFLYRAFHALPPLTNSRGEPTGAVLGVANMLRKLLASHQTRHVGVVFDAPGKTFRDDLFAAYKSHRPPMPDDLRTQIEPLYGIVKALGFPLLVETGVEADDVIGTLAIRAAKAGFKVVISTGDKDMAQLVCDQISLENTMFNSQLNRDGVIEKFGIAPEQIVDYLALVGDTSDNIPGVPKVGPKTAAKWLQTYGSADEIIKRSDEITGKVGESLREHIEQIPLSRTLATIRCDLELALEPADLTLGPTDPVALREWLTRMEFNSWLRQLDDVSTSSTSASPATPSPSSSPSSLHRTYETVLSETQFEQWIAQLKTADLFAFDTETDSLDYMSANIIGLSFAIEPGQAAYIPLRHCYMGAPEQLPPEIVLERLRPLLEDPNRYKVGQNLKYDAHVLSNAGITLKGMRFDTMLESYTFDSTGSRHDMDSLANHYLSEKTQSYEDLTGKGVKQIPFAEVRIEEASYYAAEDADITLRLHKAIWPKIEIEPGLRQVFEHLEMPLIDVLKRIERTGVSIDVDLLQKQSQYLTERMDVLEAEAFEEAGMPFNLSSPKQIQAILFDQQKLPILKRTPKGQPSTDESVLAELAHDYPLPRLILEHRSLAKLKSTYTEKLPQQVNPRTGRVHTSYHQAVAATGRLSSSDPNLQNIPIRTPEGRRIRQAFVAPQGQLILAADYSQIELRIMAHFSGDPSLCAAFAQGSDVHQHTAAEVFGISIDQVTADQRRSAKAINFGLIYGMSAFGLAKQLGIERGLAQAYIDAYFDRYPGVKAFMERVREEAKANGYVETLMGRRLHVPDIRSSNGQRRQYAERAAINAPMQGTAADIIKAAMIQVDHWIETEKPPIRMIMQVHDELVFEAQEDFAKEASSRVKTIMSEAATLHVPLVVEVGVGKNWDEAH